MVEGCCDPSVSKLVVCHFPVTKHDLACLLAVLLVYIRAVNPFAALVALGDKQTVLKFHGVLGW